MAETLRASLSAGQPLGAALKRYDLEWRSCMGGYSGSNEMVESSDGEWLRYDDAITLERKCQELEREVERLRKIEDDYAALRRFMRDRMPVLIAARLAADDGYDPEDQHGELYDLRWSGGPNPEPEGDAWSMDYLPRGEKIAADLAAALGDGREG